MLRKKLIGIVGMPGSGKSIVRKVGMRKGYGVIVMGDVVRREVESRGLEPNITNLGKVMVELREKYGAGVVAKRCLEEIEKIDNRVVLIDGIRSLEEVKVFRKLYPNFKLIAVHSSPKTRFSRLRSRMRRDDPEDWHEFAKRDEVEIKVGIGGAIALADYMIVNEGSREELEVNADKVLEEIVKDE